jgi:hypothetical protein
MQTVMCMKWGTAYGAEYANILYSMVSRHTRHPLRFVCFTDNSSGLRREIEALPLPPIELPPRFAWTPWRKLSLWQKPLADLSGNVLFLDLDVVVTGSIDSFFEFRPDASFCVAENWTQPGSGIGNTSVFRLKVAQHSEVFETFRAEPSRVLSGYSNEQIFLSRNVPDMAFWPADWCLSFKHDLLPRWPLNFFKRAALPGSARIVCFMGHPKPHEARDGTWPAAWPKRVYKHVRPTPWVGEHWR